MKGAGQFVVVAVLTAILATVAYFAFWRHSTPAAVPTGVESVKDAAGLPPTASEPAPPAKPGPSSRQRRPVVDERPRHGLDAVRRAAPAMRNFQRRALTRPQ
jgi:hypothetical protein